MKFLVVLGLVVACCYGAPNFAYSAVAPLVSPAYYGPLAYSLPPLAIKSQYHAQDYFGQAAYGHAEPAQAHTALQDFAGNKVGSFSYVKADGSISRTDYVADALGYRVVSNDLPVAPVDTNVAPVYEGVPPAPVEDTPEVVAAREAHLKEVEEVKSRSRRETTPADTTKISLKSVFVTPLAYSYPQYSYYPHQVLTFLAPEEVKTRSRRDTTPAATTKLSLKPLALAPAPLPYAPLVTPYAYTLPQVSYYHY